MSRISILVPTRNRPANMRRLVDTARQLAELPPQVIFYVDDDDVPSMDVGTELGVDVVVGQRVVLSQMWNRLLEFAQHEVVMHCGDDVAFRTFAWDRLVTEEFERHPDRLVLVHGRDGYQDANLATHGFYHRNWVEVLGRLVPPYFSSDYNDLWNTEVADRIGRRVYLPSVYTEHMHPQAGKAEWDLTHQERLARHERDDVAGLYARLAPERDADVARLSEAIQSGRFVK